MSDSPLPSSPKFKSALDLWDAFHAPGASPGSARYCYDPLPEQRYISLPLSALTVSNPKKLDISGSVVWFPEAEHQALMRIRFHIAAASRNCSFSFIRIPTGLSFHILGSGHKFLCLSGNKLGAKIAFVNKTKSPKRGSSALIGDRSFMGQVRIVLKDTDLQIERGTLWSDEILLQGSSQHGIVDLSNRAITTPGRNNLHIEEHVWIGRRAILMPGTTIGRGSVVGTGTTATKSYPECSIIVGNPGRVVKSNTSWAHSPDFISARETDFFDSIELGPSQPQLRPPPRATLRVRALPFESLGHS